MPDQAVRQRYRLATGAGLTPAPPSKPNPGFKRGGSVVKKSAGGQMYGKGGSAKKR